jgi:hypothetical protein
MARNESAKQQVYFGTLGSFGYNKVMEKALPKQAKKYFWGDDLNDLSWSKHKKYIIQTLLERGDSTSLRWLFSNVTRSEVKKMLPSLNLQPKSSNFWKVYLT